MYPQSSSIRAWLIELQSSTEVESLTALQAKSVASTAESFEALSIRNAQITIQQIRRSSSSVIDELDSVIDSLPVTIDGLAYLTEMFYHTCSTIRSVVDTCRRKGCDQTINGDRRQLSSEVIDVCNRTFDLMINTLRSNKPEQVNNIQIEANIRKLKENFGELVDVSIKKECSILVMSLNRGTGHLCIKWSLLALWQLTQNDPYMCRLLVSDRNIIPYLLNVVQNFQSISSTMDRRAIKSAALRVLTYLCSNNDAIELILSQIGVGQCLSSIVLYEDDLSFRKEAVGLLVQLTTPFIDSKDDQSFNRTLINEMTHCLTEIVRTTASTNGQILLMTTAALANISFRDTKSLVKFETLSTVMNVIKQRSDENGDCDELLLHDQLITLLANVAQKEQLEIVSSGGLIFLLDALNRETSTYDGNELACARIQQKIAVALARLSTHKSTAKIIHRLNGVKRLVQWCKQPRERNYSDTVLLASIAALKRLSQSIGRVPFQELNATDLIDLKLQQSFMLYSTQHESLV
ncbi:hypothetical protein RDWZM_003096 [Blomia tropicalis]|uniref:Protein inscuteable homologue C-terminal domain-containing protein n=1 Tax=Blomia tropicalis TaxID=40697 RepID=A0A9Q0MEM1_BLOTA|nr:hypothetical protein RDWZM_003096 [Blomia tropicalis]